MLTDLSSVVFLAQAVGPESVQVDWIEQLRQGGITAVVQAFLVVALIAISLERWISLRLKRFAPPAFLQTVLSQSRRGAWNEVESTCESADHILGRSARFALQHGTAEPGVAEGMRDMAQREVEVEHEKLASLSLIAAAAPLLGLLGTMIGMIESFQLVALYGDEGGASMLAGSIAKALITTALGLVIALPALFAHHYFKRRLQKIGKVLEVDLEQLHREWFLTGQPATMQIRETRPETVSEAVPIS